jgi:hypothetical protein
VDCRGLIGDSLGSVWHINGVQIESRQHRKKQKADLEELLFLFVLNYDFCDFGISMIEIHLTLALSLVRRGD